jgi:hypothetical protein
MDWGIFMRHINRWLIVVVVAAGLGLSACGGSSEFDNEAASDEGPSKVQPVKGTSYSRVILTRQAAQRVGIRTAPIRTERSAGAGGAQRKVMPYDALIYDAEGHAFAFTNPQPLVYVRQQVRVARIDGRLAFLAAGPAAGTPVVTVGAAELLGVEYGVEEG